MCPAIHPFPWHLVCLSKNPSKFPWHLEFYWEADGSRILITCTLCSPTSRVLLGRNAALRCRLSLSWHGVPSNEIVLGCFPPSDSNFLVRSLLGIIQLGKPHRQRMNTCWCLQSSCYWLPLTHDYQTKSPPAPPQCSPCSSGFGREGLDTQPLCCGAVRRTGCVSVRKPTGLLWHVSYWKGWYCGVKI